MEYNILPPLLQCALSLTWTTEIHSVVFYSANQLLYCNHIFLNIASKSKSMSLICKTFFCLYSTVFWIKMVHSGYLRLKKY